MKQPYEVEVDHLALGLTKPVMKLGVPLFALYLSILFFVISWMVYQAITGDTSLGGIALFLGLWLISYLTLFYITFQDDFGLSIFWLNLTRFRKHHSFSFWANTDSYQP